MLLLTNDGDWSERVLHPRFEVEREYALGLRTALDGDQVAALGRDPVGRRTRRGHQPAGHERLRGHAAPRAHPARPARADWYRATLAQGWKRQLRRMFGAVGAPVERLVRVRIGPVRIDGLHSGSVRPLKAPEIRGLAGGGGSSRRGSDPGSPKPKAQTPPRAPRRPKPPTAAGSR